MDDLSHAEKLRRAGIKKFGSETKWRDHQRKAGMKARRDTPRGFAVMEKNRVKEISKIGHKKRWHSKNPQ